MIKKGKTLKLKAVSNKPVTFKFNKKKIVSVTSKGKLKALKKGKATITVTGTSFNEATPQTSCFQVPGPAVILIPVA